ncbi:MAG TPA: M50 family metallopeptidase, partial [Polyangiaceae bacterium]|nr:M50 family metallopeptidase [Polyangiaceae bacterium]
MLGIGALIFGAFAIDVLSNYSWLKAGAVVMLFAWFVLIVVHELGHALMAASLGWHVCRIVIGVGTPVARFRVWDVPVEICRYPVGGHVVPAPTSLAGARWKSVLVFSAGPAAELLVALGILLIVGSDKLLAQPSDLWTLSAQSVAVAALLGAGFNLIPIPTREGQATDGLGMLLSPFLPNEVFEEHLALPYTTQAESLLLAGRAKQAATILQEGVSRLGDHLPARVALSAALFEANAPHKVVELLDPLIERSDVPNSLKPRILALLALA